MMLRWKLIGLIALVFFGWLVSASFFTVTQGTEALVIRFGKPVKTVLNSGLHTKAPLIDVVVTYDARLLPLEPPAEQIILGDQKRVEVDTYTRFTIADPLAFYQSLRTLEQARLQMGQLVMSALRRELGRVPLSALLSNERSQIVQRIEAFVRQEARALGVKIFEVHIHRADLPFETSQAIYDRMKSERIREAKELRAQGYERGQEIRSRAERDRTVILSEAQSKSAVLHGEADGDANTLYAKAYGKDPAFYRFARSLQTYKTSLADAAPTLLLAPNTQFLKVLTDGSDVEKPKAPGERSKTAPQPAPVAPSADAAPAIMQGSTGPAPARGANQASDAPAGDQSPK